MVPLTWIEHVASPLPRECSTTELQGRVDAVGNAHRNDIFCGGFPVTKNLVRPDHSAKSLFGQDFEQQ